MQNHVPLPSGLLTGSGPTCGMRELPVTCLESLCDNQPTGVLLMLADEAAGRGEWLAGAYCDRDGRDRLRTAAEVRAAEEQAAREGRDRPMGRGLSDELWNFRPFNETEAAEIAEIAAGRLVETYLGPGSFAWAPPRN